MAVPLAPNEAERLGALERYEILDTPAEPAFDRIARAVKRLLGVPIVLVSLIDRDRQWFKACLGMDACETSRDDSFCAHTILSNETMIVTDAATDPRFADNPFVTGSPGIRFYVGAPLRSPDGFNLGALCAVDTVPHPPPRAEDISLLEDLAQLVVDQFELRLSARKHREAETAASHLAAIVEYSQDAIISYSPDGLVLSWNTAAERLYGYTKEEVLGQPMSILVPPDSPGRVPDILDRVKHGDAVEHLETVRLRKDGQRVDVDVSISPIRNREGDIVGASSIARDITESKRLRQELQAARDQAMKASRLKSEFLATMSHEIRTPMNGVIGMIGLLLGTDLSPEQREYAETTRSSAEALLNVINDVLDFSKIEAGKMEVEVIDFDLRRVVEGVADVLAASADEKDLALATLVEAGVPVMARGDPGRLRQILINLVGNAIKFTESGGVAVRAQLAEEDDDSAVVRFEVTDTGIGIPVEAQRRLFQSFMQADTSSTRRYGGTGLGLAISKQLAELMGGKLGVRSEPGHGSTFWFTARLGKSPPTASMLPAPADLAGVRVLAVDDNAVNRDVIEQNLLGFGMRPTMAVDAYDALARLRQAHHDGQPFDLAVFDYHMPGMDGIQLAEAVRNDPASADLPLVLLTSSGKRGDAQLARKAGINGFLTKPIHVAALREALGTVLGLQPAERPSAPLVTRFGLAEAKARTQAHLLLVEDNLVNQKVATRMLEKLGYRVDVAETGAAAVAALSRFPYDLVFMDCQMPEMDGYEATERIRAREGDRRHTPIIAMTASVTKDDQTRALAAGMDEFLTKPVTIEQLANVLKRWLTEPSADDRRASGAQMSERSS